MKASLPNDYKKIFTIEEVTAAKQIIAELKEDESSAADMATYAIHEALTDRNDFINKIFEVSAVVTTNIRAWNSYNDNSGHLDVWIEATASTEKGFVTVGAYLTDIWKTGGERYSEYMYIRYFEEVKR